MVRALSFQLLSPLVLGILTLSGAGTASAALFDAGIPADWTCSGSCGTSNANGVVTTPNGSSQYGWVSTANSSDTTSPLPEIGTPNNATNRSVLQSSAFSANAGDTLTFNFNYITTDGGTFSDYAWARLLDTSLNQVALLFIAQTHPAGSSPNLPGTDATLSQPVSNIAGAPQWSALNESCYLGPDQGCGYSDWIQSTYQILDAGNYILEFGVTNWADWGFDSGLAFSGSIIPMSAPSPASEPLLPALLGLGFTALALKRRQRH